MPAVPNNGQSHLLVVVVSRKDLLEHWGQSLEFRSGGQSRLNQFRLHLHLVLQVHKWRAIQISRVPSWRHCGLCRVVVGASEFVKGACLRQVLFVASLLVGILVERDHVLEVVST